MTQADETLDIVLDVAKLPKHGAPVSGDTVEVIERPAGGISLVLADGEGTGSAAKGVSTFVAHKVIEEIAHGTTDGVTARAAHDALFVGRGGSVTASLFILSADIPAAKIVVCRNADGPVILKTPRELMVYSERVPLLGAKKQLKPNIYTEDMVEGTVAIAFTRGVERAGSVRGAEWSHKDIFMVVEDALAEGGSSLARHLLDAAVAADGGEPADDMAVVVLAIDRGRPGECTRTMTVHLPV